MTTDDLYKINDALTALCTDLGISIPDDDDLNELTHHVAHEFGVVGFDDRHVGPAPVHVPDDPDGIVLQDPPERTA